MTLNIDANVCVEMLAALGALVGTLNHAGNLS